MELELRFSSIGMKMLLRVTANRPPSRREAVRRIGDVHFELHDLPFTCGLEENMTPRLLNAQHQEAELAYCSSDFSYITLVNKEIYSRLHFKSSSNFCCFVV
jgi:hypothetical protein